MNPNEQVPTARTGHWRNPDTEPPPAGVKLNLLTCYGIAQYGTFIPNFHIGWDYCLKMPDDIKQKLKGQNREHSDVNV